MELIAGTPDVRPTGGDGNLIACAGGRAAQRWTADVLAYQIADRRGGDRDILRERAVEQIGVQLIVPPFVGGTVN